MVRAPHFLVGFAAVTLAVTLSVEPSRAHKPITSPFTYNDDVFPILRDRCARCHVAGGVAPMSLMTYEDTVPWGESIRVELLAGHMPPWSVDAAPTRFRNAQPLSAREMNVLLTWATGGTPFGNPDKVPPPVSYDRQWRLGTPDMEIAVPGEFTLPANKQEDVVEFVVPTGFSERRWLRAVDLAPGTPAIVRSATVQIKSVASSPARTSDAEALLSLWLPGDDPIAVDDGAAFEVPTGAELLVRIRYKKTWQYERKELSDRSTLGLYFAKDASQAVRALGLAPNGPVKPGTARRQSFSQTIDQSVRVLAIYPNEHPPDAGIVVTAVAPDGSRRELIAFHPQRDWTRRYWFTEGIYLERGTTLETTISIDDETPLPSSSPGTEPRPQDPSGVRLTLNVIS
jgi:hypothetical protein